MKKKLGWVIFAIILVTFTSFYAVIDKNNAIYDRKVDTTKYVAVGLEKGEKLEQTFISKEEKLDGVNVKMSVTGEAKNKSVSYVLKDESDKVVASGETSLEKIKAGKFFKFSFETVEDCKGQKYAFELTVDQCEEGSQVLVYAVPEEAKDAAFIVKGEKAGGVMVLRTVTHRFDIETFIVTAIFIIYVLGFVGWLSKVFK